MAKLATIERYGVEDLGSDRLGMITESVTSSMPTDAIILFGSYARGEATEKSDLDILVLSPLSGLALSDAYVDAGVKMFDIGVAMDFLAYNTDRFEDMLGDGASFATNVANEGVVIYGERPTAR